MNKATMRLRGRSLLGWAKWSAKELGLKVRVIDKDLVDRCGPLGGVYTALRTSTYPWVVFLSCDMPFVGKGLLEQLLSGSRNEQCTFMEVDSYAGFPFVLSRGTLVHVEQMIGEGQYSLQDLVGRCGAKMLKVVEEERWRMTNVNTPEMWERARLLARVYNPMGPNLQGSPTSKPPRHPACFRDVG